MTNSIKTISLEEIEEFLEDLKFKDICKIVFRKYEIRSREFTDYYPYILNLSQNEWFPAKENYVVLVIDEKPTPILTPILTPIPMPMPTPPPAPENWNKWYSSFIKVLYEDQICLIHAGWLEKI